MSTTEGETPTQVETQSPPSLLPYREFVLSTLKNPVDDALRSKLLDLDVDLYEFTKLTHDHGENTIYPNLLRFNIPAEVLPSLAQNLIDASKKTLDRIASIPPGSHTYNNTLHEFVVEEVLSSPLRSSLDFVSDVSPNKGVRDAANVGKDLLQAYSVEAAARVDVYDSINAFSQTSEAKELTGEKKRLLERVLRDFRRDGLHLEKSKLAELVELRKEMSSLCIKFHANIGEEDTKFTFTTEQLQGLSTDQLTALTKGEKEGEYIVTLKTPDYVPVMQYCSVPETRQILEKAYNSRCVNENSVIMEKLIELRSKQASILGFPTHAAYILDIRMAKTPETVANFLNVLNKQLDPLYDHDVKALLELKKSEFERKGWEFDNTLHPYDRSYYARIHEEKSFSIDHQKLKEYFPLEKAFSGMLDLYGHLFSIKFQKIEQDTHAWHETVSLYNVLDNVPGHENVILGQFYIDMHPRQGKYSHAAVFPLIQGCIDPLDEKRRILPVASIVCNFPASTPEKPSLISHGDLTTMLHEFGHCIHHILSMTDLPQFAGTSVAQDFVEAPSQMLENWCWYRESLELLSGHYKTQESIPQDMLDNLIASRKALQGAFNKRQLIFGFVDQRLHTMDTSKHVDTAQVYSDTMFDVMHSRPTKGTNMIASFGHLAGGYDATYYGYLWSEVFAADMFVSRFANEGILNQQVGFEYRRKILQRGDAEDADVLLRNFLGREPNQTAFLIQKGLSN